MFDKVVSRAMQRLNVQYNNIMEELKKIRGTIEELVGVAKEIRDSEQEPHKKYRQDV